MFKRLQSALLLSWVVPSLLATAQETYLYQEMYGTGPLALGDPYTQNLFTTANGNPNVTRSVKFKPFGSASSQRDDLGGLEDVEWTWRVNVTDFAAPNAKNQVTTRNGVMDVTFVDPHVVSTSFDFSWPGSGDIQSALNLSTDAFCITNLGMAGMPANVSNTYTEANKDSTDCGPVLGSECVNAITGTVSYLPGASGCYSGPGSFYTLPECASTLGYAYSQTPKHFATIETNNLNPANSSDSRLSGEGIWYAMTDARNATNTSSYEAAVNQLQIMMISPVINGTEPTPQLLCLRVNTTKLSETGANGSEGSDANGDGNPNGKNAGNSMRNQSGVGVAAILGWCLLVVAFAM